MRQIDYLIQSRVRSLINEAVHQKFQKNQTPGDPWPNSDPGAWPNTMRATQKFLEKVQASKFNIGSNSVALADHPLYVLNWNTETYWFYPDNSLFSLGGAQFGRNMGYDVKLVDGQQHLNIYSDSETRDETTIQGYFTWTGSDLKWTAIKVEEPDEKKKWQDTAHTVLDWIGFIPGIGEVADAANAIWYFVEGKVLEGCLSLISLVPIVGSAIGQAGKVAIKGISKIGKAGTKMGQIVESIVKYLNPTKGQMRDIKSGLDLIADKIASSKTLSKYIPQNKIDEVLDALKGGSSKLDDLMDTAKSAANASAGKVADLTTGVVKRSGVLGNKHLNRFIRSISSMTFERSAKETGSLISKLPLVGANSFLRKVTHLSVHPKKAMAVVESLQKTFLKNLRKDPDKLLVILRTSKDIPAGVVEAFAKRGDVLLNSIVRSGNIGDLRKLGGNIKYIDSGAEVTRRIEHLSDTELRTILTSPGTPPVAMMKDLNKLDASTLRSITPQGDDLVQAAEEMGRHAIAQDNPIWNSLLSNPGEKLKTLFPYGSFGNFTSHFEAAAMDARKWLDIVYNEVHSAAADTTLADKIPGLADNDPAREGIVYNAVEKQMKYHAPKVHAAIKTTIGRDGIVSKLAPGMGLPTSNSNVYDPNKSE